MRKHKKIMFNVVILLMGASMITFPIDVFSRESVAAKTEGSQLENDSPEADNKDTGNDEDDRMMNNAALDSFATMPSDGTVSVTPAITPTKAPTPTPTPTPTPLPEFDVSDNVLTEEVPDDIVELIERFYQAELDSSADYEELVYNPNEIDEEFIQKRTEYTIGFHNIKCYMHKGLSLVDYVVYVTYDSEIATIKTHLPSIDRILIRLDREGNPKIYLPDASYSEEEKLYVATLIQKEEVTELIDKINAAMFAAMEKDVDLMNFLSKIQSNE